MTGHNCACAALLADAICRYPVDDVRTMLTRDDTALGPTGPYRAGLWPPGLYRNRARGPRGCNGRGTGGQTRTGAGPVEPRTTSSGSNSSSSACPTEVSIWPTSSATADLPIDSIGCLTVVSGGSVQFSHAESS